MAAATHHEQRLIDFMAEACHDQIFLFTDCCCFNARGQGREISLTKSLFTVDLTEGSFLEQDSGLSHYKPTQKIMTCRCSAVGRKLVFLVFPLFFCFINILQSCFSLLQRPSSRPGFHTVTSLEIFAAFCLELFLTFLLSGETTSLQLL